jgi:hypothetical protein
MDTQSLYETLYIFLDWHPARIQTFGELIWSVVQTRTVRLKELALHVTSKGNLHAKIVKIERLFLSQAISVVCMGKIIIKLLCISGNIKIAIDRTNWQFGKSNLNFFVAAVIFGNISLPIAWLLLDKKGNSSTDERKKLIEQILEIIPKEAIELILADREFVGKEWLWYLSTTQKLPFAIRIKKNEQINHPNGGKMKLHKFFANMLPLEARAIEARLYTIPVQITCLQLEKEQLFVVSNILIGEDVLIAYKQRWSIERSFKSLKTSGFNIEDTHITDQIKLMKLFAIVSLALTICVIAGKIKHEITPIKIKKNGRMLYSLFTYGFDWLRDYFCNSQNQTLSALFRLLEGHIAIAIQ